MPRLIPLQNKAAVPAIKKDHQYLVKGQQSCLIISAENKKVQLSPCYEGTSSDASGHTEELH